MIKTNADGSRKRNEKLDSIHAADGFSKRTATGEQC